MNADLKQNSEACLSDAIQEVISIENTPFNYVNRGNGGFITLGKHMITPEGDVDGLEEAKIRVSGIDWEILFAVLAVIETTKEEMNNDKKQQS